jgi:hypothetical protein
VQIAGVEEVKEMDFWSEVPLPSIDETFANKNAPVRGIELGPMMVSREFCRENFRV